jgi:aminopeptidase
VNALIPIFPDLSETLVLQAEKHIGDILKIAIEHDPNQKAMIVYDARSQLSTGLAMAYRLVLPDANFIDFDTVTPESIADAFTDLNPLDLVVLIQSTSFRLETFRIRVELFKRKLKVIEHPHLARMVGQEAEWYIDSLAYDPEYYRGIGNALKLRIDRAASGQVESGGEQLIFSGPFENAKLNTGDYQGMLNIGGQYPIGEVFTEARELETVNGRIRIFIFADITFRVNRPTKPITLVITQGRVSDVIDTTPEFELVLEKIRVDEGEVWVREIGFGLNRAFSTDRIVDDIGTLERICGIHLSLGAKHAVYKKSNFKRREGRHHVDVFAITESVILDDEVVFKNGAWIVN